MYTEEYNRRGFPIRDFILKLILVIIFVFLLVWLLPKFISPTINNTTLASSQKECPTGTCDLSGLDALTSQIFADNMERMKDAAISYYTDERLPQEVGKSETMTLSDMIGKKIIVPLVDKNNKACDVEKSYVKITKTDDEYILKVNLKDSEKEDYILVHLGCYTYCDSYLCQKQTTNIPVKGSKVTEYVPIKGSIDRGEYIPPSSPQPVVTPTPTTTPTITIKCQEKNGTYYGKNGDVVSKEEYIKQCVPQEEKHICVKYNGKYYDKDGNVVSETAYKKSCGIEDPIHVCVLYNGNYYDKNGNVVTESVYKTSCGYEEKHICVKYNGKYYDKNGNVVSESVYKTSCGIVEYLYEYKKTTSAKLSEWTPWSSWSKTNCDTSEINCSDNDITCLKKLQILKRKEQIGTYEKTYARTRSVVKQTGSYTQKACSNYNYVIINNTIYATTTTTTYTQTNVITSTTRTSVGGWTYNGRASYSNPPRDTTSTHYKFVGADYSYCSDTCTTLPNYYYDSYTYTGGLTSVSSTTTPGSISSSSTSNTSSTTTTTTNASCGEYVTKTIPIYGTITVTEKAKRTEPLYGDVCYQSTKTRTLISSGTTSTKWSTYNDTTLLNSGYTYTGNKKQK